MFLSALCLCLAIGTSVDAAGTSAGISDGSGPLAGISDDSSDDGILEDNLNLAAEEGASPLSTNSTREPKLFTNPGGIFGEPFCGPKDTSDLTGVCKNELTCLKENGFPNILSRCSVVQGPCCEFRRTCGGSSGQRLSFWQSTGYPNPLTEPGICTFKLAPAPGVCYIKVEFLDVVLDSQIQNRCMANALYILNMADGNGSPFCGALTGYETYVKVKSSQTGLANLLSLPEHVIFLINTKTVATTVNPTKFQLRMTQIPCNDVNVFAGRSIENAEDASPVGSAREGRRKYYHRVKAPSASKGPSSSRKPTRHEVTSAELLTCLGNTTSRIYLPPFPITLSFLGNNIFADLIQKIARKDGLVIPTRIAGGTTITDVRSQYPWLGYMLIRNDNDEPFFCGAVLISPKYALTAAHCVMQRGFSRNKYQIKARFGRTDISNDQNVVNLSDLWVDQQSVTVERTVVHAMFDSVTLEDDIAVLELATPVNLTPVRLPSADAAYVGRAGKVLGWGYTGVNSGMPRNPQVLDVTVLTNDACDAAWKGLYSAYTYTPPRYIQENMVCSSANPPNAGTCTGDSGGPLVVEEAGGTHTLVGILSGAFFDCVTKGNDAPGMPSIGGTPNVATRVSEVLDFINVATS